MEDLALHRTRRHSGPCIRPAACFFALAGNPGLTSPPDRFRHSFGNGRNAKRSTPYWGARLWTGTGFDGKLGTPCDDAERI